MKFPSLQQKTLLLFLLAISVAFAWIVLPFFGAIFWGAVLAILFAPLNRRILVAIGSRRNLAALLTLLACFIMVLLPLALVANALAQEGAAFYARIRAGEISFGAYFQQAIGVLPKWAVGLLDRFGVGNIPALQQKVTAAAAQGSQAIANQALNIGQNAFEFFTGLVVMLYLLFFLLRDGEALSEIIRQAIPLTADQKESLFSKFAAAIRATVKGNVAVAAVQGLLGGLMFWFLGIQGAVLWGVLMAFLSLLPAIGAALVWGPVAIYFLLTGATWQGVTMIAFGVLVIGLIDNILRPILVRKETQMPDYVVLISTLGGITLFGLNGFVIGPVIAAMFIAAWELFALEKANASESESPATSSPASPCLHRAATICRPAPEPERPES
jgi:predicted PurR-regulated permease PerM